MKTDDVIDLDKAKLDPASVFQAPKDVLTAPAPGLLTVSFFLVWPMAL